MRSGYHYDFPTAVTFLMAGLGLGSLLALLFAPRFGREADVRSQAGSVFGAGRRTQKPAPNSRVFAAG